MLPPPPSPTSAASSSGAARDVPRSSSSLESATVDKTCLRFLAFLGALNMMLWAEVGAHERARTVTQSAKWRGRWTVDGRLMNEE